MSKYLIFRLKNILLSTLMKYFSVAGYHFWILVNVRRICKFQSDLKILYVGLKANYRSSTNYKISDFLKTLLSPCHGRPIDISFDLTCWNVDLLMLLNLLSCRVVSFCDCVDSVAHSIENQKSIICCCGSKFDFN